MLQKKSMMGYLAGGSSEREDYSPHAPTKSICGTFSPTEKRIISSSLYSRFEAIEVDHIS